MAQKYIVKHRRGTTQQWQESDIVLHDGEIAIEDRDDGRRGILIGDGKSTYAQLSKLYLQEVWTLNLLAANWVQEPLTNIVDDRWCQVVTLANAVITPYSKVDLQPTDALIAMLLDEEITLTTKNDNGVLCVIAIGGVPSADIEVQATKTEVTPPQNGGGV